jgi:ABC-type multidrug transport system ATPase subunit/ABC-type multidrug transport system permease subunit
MIETHELTKHFKDVQAVRGIDLRVRAGELVALLGPNGAGKSTTLRMLTTLIPPTSGTARVAGFDVTSRQREVRQRIGYIGQGNGAGHSQRGRDELISQGRCYGLPVADARARAAELIDSLGLGEVADRTVSTLSGGQRRRLDIAMGLIHAPDLLFLDEPSTGLDPQNRANLQEHILDLRRKHDTTIVLTTHYLDEADSMAERVIVIDHGRIIADDSPEQLKAEHVGDRIILRFPDPAQAARAAARIPHHSEQNGPVLLISAVGAPHLVPGLLEDPARRRAHRHVGGGHPADPRRRVLETDRPQPARRRRRPVRARPRGSLIMNLVTDTGTVFSRELRPMLRNPFTMVFSMVQPLVFLALFAPLLPDLPGPGGASPLQWFVPGIIVMSCLFGTSMTGSNLLFEIQTGSHERMLVTPLRRPALLIGRALKEIVPVVAQAALIVAVCVPFGFDLHLGGALIGIVILSVFCLGLGALSYTLALASKNQEWLFWTVQQTLLFPLLLLAGMLLPIDGGPGWLRMLSKFNPLTYVVDAERSLFNGDVVTSATVGGLISAVAVGTVGILVGSRAMKKSD